MDTDEDRRSEDTVELELCQSCGAELVQPAVGRRRTYCSSTCRQRAYVARRTDTDAARLRGLDALLSRLGKSRWIVCAEALRVYEEASRR